MNLVSPPPLTSDRRRWAALFVVWHLAPGWKSILPSVLSKAGPLPALHPEDGDRIEKGRIYVAPNDHHMLLERGDQALLAQPWRAQLEDQRAHLG